MLVCYTIPETAEQLKTSVEVIRREIREGKIAASKVRGKARIMEDEIYDYLERNRIEPKKPDNDNDPRKAVIHGRMKELNKRGKSLGIG